MSLSVEPLVALIRLHPAEDAVYGDPFDLVLIVRWTAPDAVLLSGLAGERMTTRYWREVRNWLEAHNVRRVVMHRKGRRVVREI